MAVDKSEFQIKIGTTADLAGLDATIAKLQGQIAATQMLGRDTSKLNAELEKLQGQRIEAELASFTKGATGAGEGAKKASEGIEEMVGGHKGIHAIGHALNQAMPGMMQFTRFLVSGFNAAIGVTLLAYEYLKDKVEEFNKQVEDLNTGPGARGEWAEKMAENVREAAVEEAVFNERLRESAERQNTLSEVTERTIAAQKQQADAARAAGDAQKQLDLARLALREKLGQITPDEAVRVRLEIDDEAFKRQLAAEKAAIQAELSTRQTELSTNQNRLPDLKDKMEDANAAALAAKEAQEKNDAKLAQEKENLEKAKESLAKSEEILSKPHHFGDRADTAMRTQAEDNEEQQQRAITSLTTAINQQKAAQTPLATAAGVAKEEAERAKSDYEDATKLAAETLKTVNKLKADLAATTAKNAALQAIHDQTSAANAQANEEDLRKRVTGMDMRGLGLASGLPPEMVDRLMAGGGTPQQQSDFQRRIAETTLRNLHGGDRENREVADRATQSLWSQTPREQIDIGSARADFLNAQSAVRTGQGSDAELHRLLNEFVGLARDIHANRRDRDQFDELSREVADLRSQLQNSYGSGTRL